MSEMETVKSIAEGLYKTLDWNMSEDELIEAEKYLSQFIKEPSILECAERMVKYVDDLPVRCGECVFMVNGVGVVPNSECLLTTCPEHWQLKDQPKKEG